MYIATGLLRSDDLILKSLLVRQSCHIFPYTADLRVKANFCAWTGVTQADNSNGISPCFSILEGFPSPRACITRPLYCGALHIAFILRGESRISEQLPLLIVQLGLH